MANESNLTPFSALKRERSVKNGKKGGIASGISRREKRDFKSILEEIADQEIKISNTIMTKKEVMAMKLVQMAMKGDLKAFELIAKVCGELTNKTDITTNGKAIVYEPITIEVIDRREQVKAFVDDSKNNQTI